MDSWLLQIFAVADAIAQQEVVDIVCGAPGLAVHAVSDGDDHYVFIDCPDRHQATLVRELVICTDFNAVLIHTSLSRTGPVIERNARRAAESDGTLGSA